jgi:Flp pilus assembly pilin Flp
MDCIRRRFWINNEGQNVAEYAVVLAVILLIVVSTMRIVGSHSNHASSPAVSSAR